MYATSFWLTDCPWDEVKKVLGPNERKRKVRVQVIVSDILYLLENGCKWKGLPPVYGNFKLVWYYYHKWMVFGVQEKLLYLLKQNVRVAQEREKEPSLVIVDAQSFAETV